MGRASARLATELDRTRTREARPAGELLAELLGRGEDRSLRAQNPLTFAALDASRTQAEARAAAAASRPVDAVLASLDEVDPELAALVRRVTTRKE